MGKFRSILIGIMGVLFISNSHAHSGRTNSSGCHNNRRTGGYHCHGTRLKVNTINPRKVVNKRSKIKNTNRTLTLTHKEKTFHRILEQAVKHKDALENELNRVISKLQDEELNIKALETLETLEVSWKNFSHSWEKKLKSLENHQDVRSPAGVAQSVEQMAQSEIKIYLNYIRNFWDKVNNSLMENDLSQLDQENFDALKKELNQENYSALKEVMKDSFEKALASIRALKSR